MTRLWVTFALLFCALPALADPLRVATFNAELDRDGPGLLLRDIRRGKDKQVAAVVAVIAAVAPDILALQNIDWDYDGAALSALADRLAEAGQDYPYRFAAQPNSGLQTGLDMDGDGRTGRARDAQGYGAFTGQGGLAILSRLPILTDDIQDFSSLLWRDLPQAIMPKHPNGQPFPSKQAQAVQRLSSTAHWVVPIAMPSGPPLSVLTFQAGPPVFDGPEDLNGRRNHDEIRFWRLFLDGKIGTPPTTRYVLAGGANLDPMDSDGRNEAIAAVLADPRLQNVAPSSPGAANAPDQGHIGPNRLDTVDWSGPGRLRVDYVLPSQDWYVVGSGVYWPEPGAVGHKDATAASRHRLVWVDLAQD